MTTSERSKGFVLAELLLAVAVLCVLASVAGSAYMAAKQAAHADDVALKLAALSNDIRHAYRGLGSYSTISGAGIHKLSIVQKPFHSDASNLYDAHANIVAVSGADTSFALTLGGNGAMTAGECVSIASALASGAHDIRIGAGAGLGTGASAGQATGGHAYKVGDVFDVNNLQTGCAESAMVIAISFND